MTADADLLSAEPRFLPAAAAYGISLGLVAAATAAALGMEQVAPIPNLSLVFVLPVVIAAVTFGLRPGLAAAAAGMLAFNFFLLEPRYTLAVAEPANVWALALLAVVAVIASGVAAEARRRTVQARAAARRAQTLQGLARRLVAAPDVDAVAGACAPRPCRPCSTRRPWC
jgi:two-component system sensor histidine kinase KdpD